MTFVGLESSVEFWVAFKLKVLRQKADIALGLDTSLTSIAAETGLFVDHGLETRGKPALPADVGFWDDKTFVPFDWGYFAFNYDTSRSSKPTIKL